MTTLQSGRAVPADLDRRLQAARAEVDCIDDSILALIEMRLRLAERVAAAKGEGPKRRPEREAQVLERLTAAREVAPEGLVRTVWSALMAESLARQDLGLQGA
jgi:chorismate mutase